MEEEGGDVIEDNVEPSKLPRYDSLDMEAFKINPSHSPRSNQAKDWGPVLRLAFQSIGIVYGDIGTSPLYVFSSTFTDGIQHEDDILGVLSLIFYTLALIPIVKYVFIVLQANDNGDGGTFALYSLICRYAKVGLIPNQQTEDTNVSNYRQEYPNRRLQRNSRVKAALETAGDDDLDLFGDGTEEEKKAAEDREAAVKASSKKKESGKSSVLLNVKPWDDETVMKKLEEAVRSIEMPGLLWGASKLVPVGYGIKKLQIMMIIVADLVSVDSRIEEHLTAEPCNEYIQSCDIVTFNKI